MPCQITMLPLATTPTSGSRSDAGTLRYRTEFYAEHGGDSRYGTGIVLAGQGLRFEAPVVVAVGRLMLVLCHVNGWLD